MFPSVPLQVVSPAQADMRLAAKVGDLPGMAPGCGTRCVIAKRLAQTKATPSGDAGSDVIGAGVPRSPAVRSMSSQAETPGAVADQRREGPWRNLSVDC